MGKKKEKVSAAIGERIPGKLRWIWPQCWVFGEGYSGDLQWKSITTKTNLKDIC